MTTSIPWPWICLLAGGGFLILGIGLRKKLKASEFWPKTNGIILESSTKPDWAKIGGERIYVVEPKVIYKYHANGKDYTSSQLALVEMNTADKKLAQTKAEKYKVGQKVVVYYNPQKPDFATLQVGDPTGGKLPYAIIIPGVLMGISGGVWLLFYYK